MRSRRRRTDKVRPPVSCYSLLCEGELTRRFLLFLPPFPPFPPRTLRLDIADLGDDSYKEIVEYLDVTDKQELTFKGFTQLYSLQTRPFLPHFLPFFLLTCPVTTENDHGETVHDLEAWGYNSKTLKPVAGGEKKEGEKKKKDVKA
jgi:hypothetical protein